MGADLVVVDYIHHQCPHLQYQEGLAQAGEEGEHQKYIGIAGLDKEQNKADQCRKAHTKGAKLFFAELVDQLVHNRN